MMVINMSKRFRRLFLFIMCFFSLISSMGFSSWIIVEDENKTVSVTPTTLVAYIEGDRSKLYSSLQAAINVAQTGSNKNVIVIPGNTINIKKNLTIPKGVNVYVPFE